MTLIPNGPVKLIGPIEIVSGSGETVERCTEVFLCRCGGSSRKPYCDGTHKKIGFRS
jgi:CDGSH-type Zn-finger protein